MDQTLVEHYVKHFDHHDRRLGADPRDVFETMRSSCPVSWSDQWGGFWVVSDYDSVRFVLRNDELFTVEKSVTIPAGMGNRRPLLPQEVDGKAHTKYRGLLNPVFAPRRITALEPKVRQVCDDLIDAVIDTGGCDFITDIAAPMPSIIFTEMMGLPYERAAQFHEWKEILMHGRHDDPGQTKQAQAGMEVTEFLYALVADRKAAPRDDIMTVLLDSEIDGEKLIDDEIVDTAFLLFMAGLDTVTSALGLSVAHLATHPEDRDRLVKDPALIPKAVEELLRYETVVLSGRTAVEDVELAGVTIKAGDTVLCNELAADRDPDHFEDPDTVDFDRHLAFAVGPHRCVGSHLARIEMRVLLEQMHARIPTYRLRDGAEITRHLTATAGIDAPLPLVWD